MVRRVQGRDKLVTSIELDVLPLATSIEFAVLPLVTSRLHERLRSFVRLARCTASSVLAPGQRNDEEQP